MPILTADPHRAILCAAGLMAHRPRRIVGKDRSGDLKCPQCKHAYDPSVFELDEPLTHCPRDGAELVAAVVWHRVCRDCGADLPSREDAR